ncbi:MAG: hypothetical protein Ct9H300mP32_6510 [Verrucomicrobiota bacterium]|nr:MAG: hypothetical protein Ct9H300mP32_6510 [Verrucomicrobiota bacterium]
MSGQQIGLAMGVFHLVGLVGQPSWGYLADRTGARKAVLVVITLGMALGFVAFGTSGVTPAVAGLDVLPRFYTSLIPQGMALGLGLLYRSSNSHFEWVRAFGSVASLYLLWFPFFLDALPPGPG